jgi:hypothetical protein
MPALGCLRALFRFPRRQTYINQPAQRFVVDVLEIAGFVRAREISQPFDRIGERKPAPDRGRKSLCAIQILVSTEGSLEMSRMFEVGPPDIKATGAPVGAWSASAQTLSRPNRAGPANRYHPSKVWFDQADDAALPIDKCPLAIEVECFEFLQVHHEQTPFLFLNQRIATALVAKGVARFAAI